jgi:putative transposase
MPRQARKKSSTGIYHIMLRGINREAIFHDDEDREKFIRVLRECLIPAVSTAGTVPGSVPGSVPDSGTVPLSHLRVKEGTVPKEPAPEEPGGDGFSFHGINREKGTVPDGKPALLYNYVLMDNHIHLLLQVGSEPLELIMKRIGIRYAAFFNWKYMRTGHLFQDRFRSEPVEDDGYFLAVYRYITLNPVKAGIYEQIGVYPWCGYRLSGLAAGTAPLPNLRLKDGIGPEKICSPLPIDISQDQLDCFIRSDQANISPFPEKMSDRQAESIILEKTGSNSIAEFRLLPKAEQKRFLFLFQEEGISPYQISRITGIPKSNVARYLNS